jgi:hypothetical protein
MGRMSSLRKVGRPSKGARFRALTRLPQLVRDDVDLLVNAPGQLGEIVATLAEEGLQHLDDAVFAPSPADAVPTWTRLPQPIRDRVDGLVKSTSRSIGDVIAALVVVGLRHRNTPARGAQQEVLMT